MIFKDKSFEKLINKFDSILNIKNDIKKNYKTTDSLVTQTIKQAIDIKDSSIEDIFSSVSVSQYRLQRYFVYDELYSGVQLIKKIISIYTDNILQVNTYSNNFILIKNTEESKDTGRFIEYDNFCKELIRFFNLEEKIKNVICFNTLKYGDSYIEVIDLDQIPIEKLDKNNEYKKKIEKIRLIKESEFNEKFKSKNKYINNSISEQEISDLLDKYINITDNVDVNIKNDKENNKNKKSVYNFHKILLKFHKPHNIVPIYTDFDTILGYLEISETVNDYYNDRSNTYMSFATLISQISTIFYSGSTNKDLIEDEILKKFSNIIINKIFSKNKINIDSEVKINLSIEIFNSLKRLLIVSNKEALFKNGLNIRYIQPENMFCFKNISGTFYPFGMSIIDPLIFPGKLYILTQLSSVISKLSRSSVLRKWTIETGVHEDTTSLIQRLKRDIKNKRITAEDLIGTKNISNILSDYKDIIAFKKRGNTMIDVDTVQLGSPPSYGTQDLEDLRREIIALSGVPSTYLGYQDMDMRDQLVHTNINFANTIVSIQNNFNKNLTNLFARIAELINENIYSDFNKYVSVVLPPPTILTTQLLESTMQSISNIQRLFNEIPEISVSPMYLISRLCPYINWEEFQREAQDFKVMKNIKSNMGMKQSGSGYGY